MQAYPAITHDRIVGHADIAPDLKQIQAHTLIGTI